MDHPRHWIASLAIISVLIVGVMYGSTSSSTEISKSFLSLKYYECSPSNESPMARDTHDELETALDEASAGMNKTLIIAILNKAYVDGEKSMLDLFLDSFWVGNDTRQLIDHLLLVAMDQTAFDRCKFLRLHCYRLVGDGVDYGAEKLYMSPGFINMMWRRTLFLTEVLKRGYSFIFTDTDIMWLRNPFTKLGKAESVDIQISVDKFKGDPWSAKNPINTGFYFVRSNNKTISLFETWYAMRHKSDYIGMKEQDVLEKLIHKGKFQELGLRVRFLDTLFFSGFCQNSRDFNAVTTVHANCCRGIHSKVADLIVVLRDWRKFKASVNNLNNSTTSADHERIGWSKHDACVKSWKN